MMQVGSRPARLSFVSSVSLSLYLLVCTDLPTARIYTLSLHDALPISAAGANCDDGAFLRLLLGGVGDDQTGRRSEEHTSELQSRRELVCRLLLEKKKRARLTLLISCWTSFHIASSLPLINESLLARIL